MSSLRKHLTNYLSMRRALGFKLRRPAKALAKFIVFLEQHGALYITTSMALQWAQQPCSAQPATWAARLSNVRGFARYVSAFDPRTEIPPADLLPHQPKRIQPYLYTDEEIQQLMEAALSLSVCPDWPAGSMLKRQTYYCLIGLLAVTGMRISEATNLRIKNVDLLQGVITIEGAKLGKSRLVPLHASTVKALTEYSSSSNKYLRDHSDGYFFINRVGRSLDQGTVRRIFYELSYKVGLRRKQKRSGKSPNKGPRIHDLRHRFAVQTMLRWYQNGDDVERKLPVLSTYLGHVHVSDTYWYLTAYPELMGHVIKRLEQRWEEKL
jgi:integrase/recombinase XerD